MTYLEIAAGFILLFGGGEMFVRGSVALARRIGVSPLLIGLTLVGFGTSLPELFTSIQAARYDSPGIAVGNVVGSNTANVLLILGLAVLIHPPRVAPRAFLRDGTVVFSVAVIAIGVALYGELNRPLGAVLLALLAGYIGLAYAQDRGGVQRGAQHGPEAHWAVSVLLAAGALIVVLFGAGLLVNGSIALARQYGISETVIGLTIVAVGTSLPELVTSLVAAMRRQTQLAFGNVIGSNIFNVLGILGATALVRPIPVPREILVVDIWVMLAATAMLVVFSVSGWRIIRTEGALLLLAYGSYAAYLFVAAG
jgi:cation:H+ antiporter